MNTILHKNQTKKHRAFTHVLLLLLFATFSIQAQITELPYFCGFETADDTAGWVLNPVATGATKLPNKWAIGRAVANMGLNSMYISKNGDGFILSPYKEPMNMSMKKLQLSPPIKSLHFRQENHTL